MWISFWVFVTILTLVFVFREPIQAYSKKVTTKISAGSLESAVAKELSSVKDHVEALIGNAVEDLKNHVSLSNRNQAVAITNVTKKHLDEAIQSTGPTEPVLTEVVTDPDAVRKLRADVDDLGARLTRVQSQMKTLL